MTQMHDIVYLNSLRDILLSGRVKRDRTNTGTISKFNTMMSFDLRDGTIPLLTSKKMFTKSMIHELLWYLTGDTNIKYLQDRNVHIWDAWADAHGNLGPVYGEQWRKWKRYDVVSAVDVSDIPNGYKFEGAEVNVTVIDQVQNVIDAIKTNPHDRRMIVSAWNVGEIKDMRLPPCHFVWQCYALPLTEEEAIERGAAHPFEISMKLTQRSADFPVGVPFNIAQYSMLLRMICEVTGTVPGDFIWDGGDCHIYSDQVAGVQEQLQRPIHPSPKFKFARRVHDIDDFKFDDFVILNYAHEEAIPYPVAV